MQPVSKYIWGDKYQLKDDAGNFVDKNVDDTLRRVAKALASQESIEQEEWEDKFYQALLDGAVPAGRIMSNAGATKYKPATSLINCTVSRTVRDSLEQILDTNKKAGMTLKAGCGIGYEFSTLRPSGATVGGVGAQTSGPLSFMDIYDKTCFTVRSAGGRRGAQMATFDISHPDVVAFIKAKRQDGTLRQFNLSLLITKDFMDTVIANGEWNLVFPVHKHDYNENNAYVWKEPNYPVDESTTVTNDRGLVAHRIYETLPARDIWDIVMESTYDYAEPGFILIDKVNEMNNNWFCENVRATNPCGEQPLPPDGSCLLGSINLTKFVRDPFKRAKFDWEGFEKVIAIFTRMLDNVVEINGLPLKEQRAEISRKRRHGMGFMGLGSAMNMLGINYGSNESLRFTTRVAKIIALAGFRVGHELALEKGPAPVMLEEFADPSIIAEYRKRGGDQEGDTILGKELWAFSNYMLKVKKADGPLWELLRKDGCRFTHHSSVAPTGTIALSLGNNCSNGIEPSFAHHYTRNLIVEGKNTKESVDVWSYESLVYRDIFGADVELPSEWDTSDNLTPKEHIDVQAAAQVWIDSSISKTVNIPTDFPFDEFKEVYTYAYNKGLKGVTTFRFNPEVFQGVLVKKDDLANTEYTFTMDDGSDQTFKGDDMITYEGQETTAANLFDALKEGYYGKL